MSSKTVKSPLSRIISVIGWQAVVLMTVLFATVQANDLAQDLLTYYGIFLLVPGFMYAIIVFMPQSFLDKSEKLEEGRDDFTSIQKIAQRIGTSVSIVEIALLVSHSFLWLAAIWIVVEILQYAAHVRMRRTLENKASIDELFDTVITKHYNSLKIEKIQTALQALSTEIDGVFEDMPDNDARKLVVNTLRKRYTELKTEYVDEALRIESETNDKTAG